MTNPSVIFLCHAKKDLGAVKQLHERLKTSGFSPWLDEIDILPGQNWDVEIKKIIKQAGFALICVSKISVQERGYIQKEIKWALDRQDEMLEDDIFLIVVKLEACELPDRLSEYQWCDLFKSDGFERLLKSLELQLAKADAQSGKITVGQNTPSPTAGTIGGGRCFIEIRKTGDTLFGTLRHGNSATARSIPDPKLDNESLISIRNKTMKMSQILKTLIRSEAKDIAGFDDSYQLDLGQYLSKQLFPEFSESAPPNDVEVHISTSVHNLLLLPWHVLSHNRSFLSSAGWTVSVSGNSELKPCSLPDIPKVLIVIPQPAGKTGTGAEAHLEALESELSSRNHVFTFGQNLQAAYTWEEFTHKLESFSPDVVYFYGHCADGVEKTKLCLASGTRHDCCDIAPDEFISGIGKMGVKPVLVYLNCLNISAGLINFGVALSKMVPAVITSR